MRFSALGIVVTALMASGACQPGTTPQSTGVPLYEPSQPRRFTTGALAVVRKAGACGAGATAWTIETPSVTPVDYAVCQHRYVPRGREGFDYIRSFSYGSITAGAPRMLACLPSHPENYIRLAAAYSADPARPPFDIEDPVDALARVRTRANGDGIILNTHVSKQVAVTYVHRRGEKPQMVILRRTDGTPINGDGWVTHVAYTNPYSEASNLGCETPAD